MKVKFITLGCKTNQYETNAMEQKLKNDGFEIIREDDKNNVPDICIVNTCSVTNVAERKSRQMLRKVKETNKNAIVVACGCYAQVAKEQIEKIPEVDIVLGINEKNHIEEFIKKYLAENKSQRNLINENGQGDIIIKKYKKSNTIETENKNIINSQKEKKIAEVSDVLHENDFQDFGTTTYTESTRAIVKIQDGCDRFCSYCIIPYARGKVRSRKPESIISEIEEVAQKGFKEVVLTGIHIASYGKDFKDEDVNKFRKEYGYENEYKPFNPKDDLASGGFRLIELLEQINKIEKIERIRLGSIEPKLITEDFIKRLSKLNKICDHFHLSLQSGCNETLKRMNRRYTTEEFEESANIIRAYFKNVHLTTDIIVGFPGETDEEFEKTYDFLSKIKFYKMHIFKYSIRRGTVAEKMENQIDGKVKEERSKKLIELSNKLECEYNEKEIGNKVKVLFEEEKNGFYRGHTTNYEIVNVKSEKDISNQILDVTITKQENLELIGKL